MHCTIKFKSVSSSHSQVIHPRASRRANPCATPKHPTRPTPNRGTPHITPRQRRLKNTMTRKKDDIIDISGARGEGGGQVVRVAMSLASITSQAVRISNVRASRPKGGTSARPPSCLTPTTSLPPRQEKQENGTFVSILSLDSMLPPLRPLT